MLKRKSFFNIVKLSTQILFLFYLFIYFYSFKKLIVALMIRIFGEINGGMMYGFHMAVLVQQGLLF